MKKLKIWWMKRRARGLMMPWVELQETADCGNEMLVLIAPHKLRDYNRGVTLARAAMALEKQLEQELKNRF